MFNIFLFLENRALYEIIWGKYGGATEATDDNIIRRTRVELRIKKAADTQSEYVTFLVTIVTRTGLSGTLYVGCHSSFDESDIDTPEIESSLQ
jgi:hypothetical protein